MRFNVNYSTTVLGNMSASGVVSMSGSNVMQVNQLDMNGGAAGAERGDLTSTHRLNSVVNINTHVGTDPNTGCAALMQTLAHEIGHAFSYEGLTSDSASIHSCDTQSVSAGIRRYLQQSGFNKFSLLIMEFFQC